MGNFRIVIESVGGHGCDRAAKVGTAIIYRTDDVSHMSFCPDCAAKKLVDQFMRAWSDTKATLTHWPNESSEVVDDLAMGKRVKGNF